MGRLSNPPAHKALADEGGRDEILIRVIDGGMGISKEILPKIFHLFARVDTSINNEQTQNNRVLRV